MVAIICINNNKFSIKNWFPGSIPKRIFMIYDDWVLTLINIIFQITNSVSSSHKILELERIPGIDLTWWFLNLAPDKGPYSQSYGLPSAHVRFWELDRKEGRTLKNWCLRTVVPWTTRRSNQSILREINLEYSLEGLMLKLKLQYFGHLNKGLIGKVPDAGKDWRQKEKRASDDEMVGWHHWLNGHEFEQTPGVADGQGSLACCSPWGRK